MSTASVQSVEFYWRPGCGFCGRLAQDLHELGIELIPHNIWDDPAAAERVRSVDRGHETVPTVFVDGHSLVNPRASEVVALLAQLGTQPGAQPGAQPADS